MTDNDMFKFIDENNLDNIESIISTLHSIYGEDPEFKKNFYIIVYLLSVYYNDNNCNDKLDFFLSDITTINYLKDKDIMSFLMGLVNIDNKYAIDFIYQYDNLKLVLETSKKYLDNKRSNYKVLDNEYLSMLIDLYANYSTNEVDNVTRELFFLVLYNNYSNLDMEDLDYFEFMLTRVYMDFMEDEYFRNADPTNKEKLYEDIYKFLNERLGLSKDKVK